MLVGCTTELSQARRDGLSRQSVAVSRDIDVSEGVYLETRMSEISLLVTLYNLGLADQLNQAIGDRNIDLAHIVREGFIHALESSGLVAGVVEDTGKNGSGEEQDCKGGGDRKKAHHAHIGSSPLPPPVVGDTKSAPFTTPGE